MISLSLNSSNSFLFKFFYFFLKQEGKDDEADEEVPYAFFVDETEIVKTLEATLELGSEKEKRNFEKVTQIIYQPQALFRLKIFLNN